MAASFAAEAAVARRAFGSFGEDGRNTKEIARKIAVVAAAQSKMIPKSIILKFYTREQRDRHAHVT